MLGHQQTQEAPPTPAKKKMLKAGSRVVLQVSVTLWCLTIYLSLAIQPFPRERTTES